MISQTCSYRNGVGIKKLKENVFKIIVVKQVLPKIFITHSPSGSAARNHGYMIGSGPSSSLFMHPIF